MGQLDLLRRVTELEAENERLREEVRTAPQWVRTYWREKCEQAEARTRALEAAIEGNTFCECFDEYGRKRPTPCWRCAALTEPRPPQEEPR